MSWLRKQLNRSVSFGKAPKGTDRVKHVAKVHRVNGKFTKCNCFFLGIR